MAVAIRQQPAQRAGGVPTPQAALSSLVYVVSGSNTLTLPQYQFVIDVQDETKTILTRLRQYPNPSGQGVIDIANILTDYLDLTPQFGVTNDRGFLSVGVSPDTASVKLFNIAFGEEYGTSISSSVTIYNGKGSAGAPGVSGSTLISYSAVDNANDNRWNELILITGSRMSTDPTGLTQATATPFDADDFASISFLNNTGNYVGGTVLVGDVVATVYDSAGTVLKTGTIGTGTGSTAYKLDIGVGPRNLQNVDSAWRTLFLNSWSNIANWKVEVNYTVGGVAGSKTYWYKRNDCNYYTYNSNFNFVNRYGAWDTYKINYPFLQTTKIERNNWTQPRVNYSTSTANAGIDPFRRGQQQYYTSYNDSFSTTTPPLSQSEAVFLSQLMESQNVFWTSEQDYKVGGSTSLKLTEPVVITNSNYTWWTNPRGQKLFQYTFEWTLANERRPRTT